MQAIADVGVAVLEAGDGIGGVRLLGTGQPPGDVFLLIPGNLVPGLVLPHLAIGCPRIDGVLRYSFR